MIKGDPMYSIIYHKPERLVRLKWLAGTAGMTDQDFKETLEAFAESALQHSAKRLLIDVSEFKHRPSPEVAAWRDEVVVPKYNRAGVKKIAWVWPNNTPSNEPTSEKGKFETAISRRKPRRSTGSRRKTRGSRGGNCDPHYRSYGQQWP